MRGLSAVAALLLVPACLLAGCGGGASREARSTATSTTTTSSTPTSTTPLPGAGHPTVTVGDMNTPEQFVLGDLYYLALRAQGFSVSITRNIGTTAISEQALHQGTLDVYPEYLDTWDAGAAGETGSFPTLASADAAAQLAAQARGMELLSPTPGADTPGLAVTSAYAEGNRLRKISDLDQYAAHLTLGAPPQFTSSPEGLPAVERAYGLTPAATQPIDIGEQYTGLQDGTVQVAYVNSTDPQLATGMFRLLADPKHVLGFGNIVPVTTSAVLAKEGPAFVSTIDRVSSLLTSSVLRQLNAEAAATNGTPEAVASAFLASHHLIAVSSGPS